MHVCVTRTEKTYWSWLNYRLSGSCFITWYSLLDFGVELIMSSYDERNLIFCFSLFYKDLRFINFLSKIIHISVLLMQTIPSSLKLFWIPFLCFIKFSLNFCSVILYLPTSSPPILFHPSQQQRLILAISSCFKVGKIARTR